MSNITLGTDPELFCVDASPDALAARHLPNVAGAIPAWFVLGLTNPEQHIIELPAGALGPDGLALEFTTHVATDPSRMVEFLRLNIQATQRYADLLGAKLSVNPRVYVDQAYINMLPKEYGKAASLQLLGCDPDVNAYGFDIPAKPNPKTHNYRTSGGHVHLGIGELTKNRAMISYLSAVLDATLGCASTILCNSAEAFQRKEQYGQAGMYRVDHSRGTYEYRTMPAQALIQTPELSELVFTAVAGIGDWFTALYEERGQAETITEITRCVGDLDTIFERARRINAHDVEACRAMVWTPFVESLLAYKMPSDFYLHGWGE